MLKRTLGKSKSIEQVKDNAGAMEFGPLIEAQVKEIQEVVAKFEL